MNKLNNECLEFRIQFLDHRLVEDAYQHAVISGLYISVMKDGGGWLEVTGHTTHY